MPSLEKLQKEGQSGQRKIQEWTRYMRPCRCASCQGAFWLTSHEKSSPSGWCSRTYMNSARIIAMAFWLMGSLSLTAGSIFLMWLGEQIDEYGLGNGISFLILAGIVARMPNAVSCSRCMTNLKATAIPNPGKLNEHGQDSLPDAFSFVFIVPARS